MDPLFYHSTDLAAFLPPFLLLLLLPIIAVLALWTLVWKGIGLWYAGRNNQKGWFIFILLVNALGIPAIVYLLWFRKTKKEKVAAAPAPAPAPVIEAE